LGSRTKIRDVSSKTYFALKYLIAGSGTGFQASKIFIVGAWYFIQRNNLQNVFVNLQRFIYLRPAKAEMFIEYMRE